MTLAAQSATTALGTLTVSPVTLTTLTGQAATTAQGTATTTQATNASLVGLGQSVTASLGDLRLKYYQDLTPRTSASYTKTVSYTHLTLPTNREV